MMHAVAGDGAQKEFLHFAAGLAGNDDGSRSHVVRPFADCVADRIRIGMSPVQALPTCISSQHLQGLEDAVLRNIQAVSELSDLVRTSFGPNGALRFSCTFLD